MLEKLKQRFNALSPLVKYLFFSVLVTVLDTAVVWILAKPLGISLQIANTAGVVTGFAVHYLLSSKSVFQAKFGISGFLVYFITFLMGLWLANFLIVSCNDLLFAAWREPWRFLLSKGISVIIPFFILYFVRKLCYNLLDRFSNRKKGPTA